MVSHREDGFISALQMYCIVFSERKCMVFDCRPKVDYECSNIKIDTCLTSNIPEDVIKSGLSANALGKYLDVSTRTIWEQRNNVEIIILLDWNTTKSTVATSKAFIVKEMIVKWDPHYDENKTEVVLLNGGYIEWWEHFPMFTTNALQLLHEQNMMISELLDLDAIEYPEPEHSPTSPALSIHEIPNIPPDVDRSTKDEFIRDVFIVQCIYETSANLILANARQPIGDCILLPQPIFMPPKKKSRKTPVVTLSEKWVEYNSEMENIKTQGLKELQELRKKRADNKSRHTEAPSSDISLTSRDMDLLTESSSLFTNKKHELKCHFPKEDLLNDMTNTFIEESPDDVILPTKVVSSQTIHLPPSDTLPVILQNKYAVAESASANSTSTSTSSISSTYTSSCLSEVTSNDSSKSFFSLVRPTDVSNNSSDSSTNIPNYLAAPIGIPGTSSFPAPKDASKFNKKFDASVDTEVQPSHIQLKSTNGTSSMPVNGTPLPYTRTGLIPKINDRFEDIRERLLYEARNKKKPEIPPTTRQDQGTSTRLDTDIIENIPTQNLNTIIPNPLTDNQVSTIYQKDSKHKLKYREVYSTAELRQLIRGEPIYEVQQISETFNIPPALVIKAPRGFIHGVKGLKNLHNTCFMNSILQALSNTYHINQYFINGNHERELCKRPFENCKFTRRLAEVIINLWTPNGEDPYYPRAMKNITFETIKTFQLGIQQDAHEYLCKLIEFLHNEMKHEFILPKYKILTPIQESWINLNGGKESVFTYWFVNHLRSSLACTVCSYKRDHFETYYNITLDLPQHQREASLEYALQKFLAPTKITGYKCPKCNCPRTVIKQLTFAAYAPYLILTLSRYQPNSSRTDTEKNLINVTFPTILKLPCYKYKLYGIISHIGEIDSGHYVANCQNPLNKKWYKFDDEAVKEIEIVEEMSSKDAYILFYQMCNESHGSKPVPEEKTRIILN